MSESGLPAAGWYPAPHAHGEMRYWDGAVWTEPVPAGSSAEPPSPKKPISRRTGVLVAGGALILGLVAGGGMGSAASGSQVSDLSTQIAALQTDVAEAAQTVVDAGAEVKTATDKLTAAQTDAAKAKTDLATSVAEVTKMREAATAAQTELDARAAQITDLQGRVSAQVAPQPEPVQPAAPSTAYYKNCDAARAAGAAPVRRGDPGYASHLDRDGDGIGCE